MSEEEPQLSRYNIDFAGGKNNSYIFATVQGIIYEIQFKPTPYLFGEAFVLADEIVELVIKVANNPLDRRPPYDALVAPTIAAVVSDFYQKSSLAITIFICDTADRKQEARWRKFNRWYEHFSGRDYGRMDDQVWDEEQQVTYHCAVIVKNLHPYLPEVGLAFFRLMQDYRTGK